MSFNKSVKSKRLKSPKLSFWIRIGSVRHAWSLFLICGHYFHSKCTCCLMSLWWPLWSLFVVRLSPLTLASRHLFQFGERVPGSHVSGSRSLCHAGEQGVISAASSLTSVQFLTVFVDVTLDVGWSVSQTPRPLATGFLCFILADRQSHVSSSPWVRLRWLTLSTSAHRHQYSVHD